MHKCLKTSKKALKKNDQTNLLKISEKNVTNKKIINTIII